MSLTLELPSPINEELTQDSQREGISEMEHAALLVCLASAFKQDEPHTPFQKAVRVFLSDHSLDADQVVSVFEGLVRVCLAAPAVVKIEAPTGKGKTEAALQFLSQWRNAVVHQPVDESYDVVLSDVPPSGAIVQQQGRISRASGREKEVNDPRDLVSDLLAQWQAEDRTPLRTPVSTQPGETPTQALFRKWAVEDANMTDEEKEAEDKLWEDIEQGVRGKSPGVRQKAVRPMIIVLDTFPASSVAKRPGKRPSLSDQCHQWVDDCEDAGHTILVPAICYYEALRELERRQATRQIERLKDFCLLPARFLPLTTLHLEAAAKLWGRARRGGRPTASDNALDADVLLAAQALRLNLPVTDFVVATTNVSHLSQFAPCEEWTNIKP